MRETIQGSVRRDKQGYFSTSPAASQGTQLFYLKLNYMLPRQDSETKLSLSPKGANGSQWNYSTVIILHQPKVLLQLTRALGKVRKSSSSNIYMPGTVD